MDIQAIIDTIDLPSLVLKLYPDSQAKPGHVCKAFASWRNNVNTPAVGIEKRSGRWKWKDYATDQGGDALDFLMEIAGYEKDEAIAYVKELAGISGNAPLKPAPKKKGLGEIREVYNYWSSDGQLRHQTLRFEGKQFLQRRPGPQGTGQGRTRPWAWGMTEGTYKLNRRGDFSKRGTGLAVELPAAQTVLYRQPEVEIAIDKGDTIIIAEGEKDVDNLRRLGFIATCNAGGCNHWTDADSAALRKANVVVFADFDKPNEKTGERPGTKGAENVIKQLADVAATIRGPVYMPRGLKDVSDYIAAGATKADVQALIDDAPEAKATKAPAQTQGDILLKLADDHTELYRDQGDRTYATFTLDGLRKTYPIRSNQTEMALRYLYYKAEGKAPSADALSGCLATMEAKAWFEAEEAETFVRTAAHGDKIYIDLADEKNRAVEIDADGWRIISGDKVPVLFQRPRGLEPLPVPESGGSIHELRELINLTDSDWVLLVSYLAAALRPTGPYPILTLVAEQGSGKSTTARMIKALVDPHASPIRSEPRDEHSLFIATGTNQVIAYDNISNIKPWLSDALCVIATGGAFATRELYSGDQETILDAQRPLILTGIEELATRGDLLSRSLIISLPRLEHRITEREVWRTFEAMRPRLIGALFSAVAEGLANIDNVELEKAPRMADFAAWATACEPAFGYQPNTFLLSYEQNRIAANDLALDVSPVPNQLRVMLDRHLGQWQGTATELLDQLEQFADFSVLKSRQWPGSPAKLSNMLRRLAPNLREAEIDIQWTREGKEGRRLIVMQQVVSVVSQQSSAAENSVTDGETRLTIPENHTRQPQGERQQSSATQTPSPTQTRLLADEADATDDFIQTGRVGGNRQPNGAQMDNKHKLLWKLVNTGGLEPFKHPISHYPVNPNEVAIVVRNALEGNGHKSDNERIIDAAYAALPEETR